MNGSSHNTSINGAMYVTHQDSKGIIEEDQHPKKCFIILGSKPKCVTSL